MKKNAILTLLFVCVTLTSFSQNKENKWAIGLSGSLVGFSDATLKSKLKERFNVQFPKINISRYLFSGLTADAELTFGTLNRVDGFYTNSFDYLSLGANIRYDFNLSYSNLAPYVGFGASFIGAPSTVEGSKTTPTTNYTFGETFWFHPQWGINAQAT